MNDDKDAILRGQLSRTWHKKQLALINSEFDDLSDLSDTSNDKNDKIGNDPTDFSELDDISSNIDGPSDACTL